MSVLCTTKIITITSTGGLIYHWKDPQRIIRSLEAHIGMYREKEPRMRRISMIKLVKEGRLKI